MRERAARVAARFIVPIFQFRRRQSVEPYKKKADAPEEKKCRVRIKRCAELKVPQFAQKREQLGAWAGLMKNSFAFLAPHARAPTSTSGLRRRRQPSARWREINKRGLNHPQCRLEFKSLGARDTNSIRIQDFRHKR